MTIPKEHSKGTKLMKKLGVNMDLLLMLGLLEISRKYIDSGVLGVLPRQIANSLNLPLESVLNLYNDLNKLGLIHMNHVTAKETTDARPSQRAYLALHDFALSFKKNQRISVNIYRQSKASLGRKVNLDLFQGFPDAVKESRWKRVKFRFEDLGLIIYLYESGIVDFKGRNTSKIHEGVALFRLLSRIGETSEGVIIRPYRWSITIDLGQFVKVIDLKKLHDTINFISPTKNALSDFDPARAPHVLLRIRFDGFTERCTILVWSTGKFMVSAGDLSLIDKGIEFMFEYLKQNEQWTDLNR